MRSIQDAAAVAFAFKNVLNLQVPTVTHTNALVEFYRLIKPDLQRRPWPPNEYVAWPPRKEWPSGKGIVVFYKRWWDNVYGTARKYGLRFVRKWRVVETVAAQPVRVQPQLGAVWQLVAKKIARKRKNGDFSSRLVV